MFDQFTLGIEEEFQIVDPTTRQLRSHVAEILEEGKMLLGEQIKPEMIQSMIEVGTGICRNIQEARTDITRLRSIISGLARKNGLAIVAASTHPISRWQDQKIFDDERYELLVQELQTVARSLLSSTLIELEPDAHNVVELLDGSPGAYERAQFGLQQAKTGETIALDEL